MWGNLHRGFESLPLRHHPSDSTDDDVDHRPPSIRRHRRATYRPRVDPSPDPDGEPQDMSRRSIGALTALLLLSLALAACGGGTANPATDASAAPAAATAAPVEPDASTATGGGIDGTLTPGTTLNACEIVTSEDVKAATKATDRRRCGHARAFADGLVASQDRMHLRRGVRRHHRGTHARRWREPV